jgi:hypothetical protein
VTGRDWCGVWPRQSARLPPRLGQHRLSCPPKSNLPRSHPSHAPTSPTLPPLPRPHPSPRSRRGSYAFYVQPCAVPLLRTLPPGDEGARVLCAAVHLTFVLTALAYLCVGLGGLLYFGEGHVPQDLLQGFGGRIG